MGYGAVAYREVFPGSDLTFRGSGRQLQVLLRVSPGESLDSLVLAFDNAHLSREDRRVIVESGSDRWILSGLTASQFHSGKHRRVILSHVLAGGEIRLDIGGYSPSHSLTLAFRIASVFSSGNAPQGTPDSPLWGTTLGGSDDERPGGMDHTADGDVVVTGSTSSSNFPYSKGAFQTESLGFGSGFVAKLDRDNGEVLWSTYFGDFVSLNDIVVAADGKICVTGRTSSNDLPLVEEIDDTLGGFVDALVACFDQDGDLLFSSYLGGSGSDEGAAIDADPEGDLYLTGITQSPDFPQNPSLFGATGDPIVDAFVLKLTSKQAAAANVQGNQNGVSIAYGTYLGGSGQDLATGIAVDSQGCAYVTGSTSPDGNTFDFPTQNAFQKDGAGGVADVFVTKINAAGDALVYSTYLGGNDYDDAFAISVPVPGEAYVGGLTASRNFPLQNPLQENFGGGPSDAFVALILDGPALAGTVLAGESEEARLAISTYRGEEGFDRVSTLTTSVQGDRTFVVTGEISQFPGAQGFSPADTIRFRVDEALRSGGIATLEELAVRLQNETDPSIIFIQDALLNKIFDRLYILSHENDDDDDDSGGDDPAPLGAAPLFTDVVVRSRVFSDLIATQPLYLFAAGTPCSPCPDEEVEFDGVALTNFAGTTANVNLELFLPPANGGSPSRVSPQGANQAVLVLPPGQQVAQLRTDLFPDKNQQEPGWIELTGDTGSLGTFFQFGTDALSQLDGGVAITETSTSFTFTRVFDGPGTFRGQDAGTGISLFNPNDAPVTVELTYLFPTPAGSTQAELEFILEIPARTMAAGQPSEIFGAPVGGGVIRGEVTQGDGVVAFELIQLVNQTTILGLNAATGNPGTRAYSAQLASQPGLFTSVNLINTAEEARNVTLRAIGADGSSLADPVQRLLQPGESFTEDAGVLFGGGMAGQSPSGEVNLEGSLVVEADGDGMVGDVIFGDATNFQYAASLPLQTQTFEEALFNQVANIAGFFTGLAFFYPGPIQGATQGQVPDAEITIQVFRPGGEMVGESLRTLAVGERLSKLVAQLVEEAVNLGGGYVRIFSTQPIIGQMLFGVVGPEGIQLFSAVPPTVIR